MRRFALILATVFAAALGTAAPALADDPVEGTLYTTNLVTFSAGNVPKQVTIDWGDGSPKQPTGVDLQDDKTGKVGGAHTYAKFGFYSVKVVDNANPDNYETTSLNVKDAPVTAQGTTFKTTAAGGGVLVATVVDGNPLGNPADFKATVDWGDGTTGDAALALVAGQPGHYTVTASHGYPNGATYLAGVTIRSTDGGDANTSVQSTADGGSETSPAATARGSVLDFGPGSDPTIVTEADGTANLAWTVSAPGRSGDAVVYCRLPRGATACSTKRTLQVDALFGPKILMDRNGTLRLVISYNGVLQLGGGTLVMTSTDQGANWGYSFYPVNTGLFQGAVIDATLSRDGSRLYALFGDFPAIGKSQLFAQIDLDRGTVNRESNPGQVTGVDTYSARTVAVLPDGRVVLAGHDTDASYRGQIPKAAIRVVADASDALVSQPWVPIRGGEVLRLAASPQGASMMNDQTCDKGVDVSALRGTTLSAPKALSADRGGIACNAGYADDLSVDQAGGRHAVYLSSDDGCQGRDWDDRKQICVIYRYAKPGGDFGPKTTVAKLNLALARGLSVSAGKDGQGWITYQDLDQGGTIKVVPTDVESQAVVDPGHAISLTFKPSSECSKSGENTLGVQVTGLAKGKPTIKSVKWSASSGLLPGSKTDSSGPFSQKFTINRKKWSGLSSTGVIVFSMTVHADVKYSAGGKGLKTAKLQQTLSYYCGVKFDKVKK